MNLKKQKIGLFFGSFNPIHNGHLIIANFMAHNTSMDQVWFVVSPCNPLKKKETLLNEHHRLALVKIAIDDNPLLRACDIEFKLPQPSYTTHTLAYLSDLYPNKEFCLIMGGDNLESIEKWKNYQSIVDNYDIYVYPRPNTEIKKWESLNNIHFLDVPLMELSSSFIRNQIMEGKNIRYMTPDAVIQYIEDMHFYKKNK